GVHGMAGIPCARLARTPPPAAPAARDRRHAFPGKIIGRPAASPVCHGRLPRMKLSGLNAIVTGASQGLGLEIARHFVREGASVAICARDAARLATAKAALSSLAKPDQKVVALGCDVSDPAAVDVFAAAAIDA